MKRLQWSKNFDMIFAIYEKNIRYPDKKKKKYPNSEFGKYFPNEFERGEFELFLKERVVTAKLKINKNKEKNLFEKNTGEKVDRQQIVAWIKNSPKKIRNKNPSLIRGWEIGEE